MKTFVAFALAGVATAITQNDIKFMDFLARHGKDYNTITEFNFRANLFAKKDAELDEINANPENTFTVGHNTFSDWTEEEYMKMNGNIPEEEDFETAVPTIVGSFPSSIDWKAKGAVTGVKSQGCGDCWIFSGTAGVEGSWFQQTGKLWSLSEQQSLDCCPQGNGCNGGVAGFVYNYATTNKIQKMSNYPYKGKKGTCKADGTGAKVAGSTRIKKNSVNAHKTAIARGVIGVSVAASSSIFGSYSSGIINSTKCGTSTNHAVAAIGYTSKYYIIKNSWGPKWGESGFARIAIVGDGEGICGIQMQSVAPYIL